MRKSLFFCFFFIGHACLSFSQDNYPVKWHFSARKIANNTYEIRCSASIEESWHIYSQNSENSITQPTLITIKPNPLVILGKNPFQEKGNVIQQEQKAVDGLLQYYENNVDFVKTVTLKARVKTTITGTIKYMACTNEKCLPPAEKRFNIPLQ